MLHLFDYFKNCGLNMLHMKLSTTLFTLLRSANIMTMI